MAYQPTTWRNDITPLNERNMNNIENGIVDNEAESARISERLESAIKYIQEVDEAKATPAQVDTKIADHDSDESAHPSILALVADRYTKTETDDAITAAIAALIDEAPEELDTLRELVDYIKAHESDALDEFTAIRKDMTAHEEWDQAEHDGITATLSAHARDTELHVTQELQDKWNDHTENSDIHVSLVDKANWDGKAEGIHSHVWTEVYACEENESGTDTIKDVVDTINESLDTKLDKVTSKGNNRAYTITSNGEQSTERITQEANADTIAQRHAGGALTVGEPVEDTDATNKAYVDTTVSEAIAALVNSSPEVLDTLSELSAAINDDPNFHETIINLINTKADKEHYHDDRYYTETECDDLFALINHNHNNIYYTKLECDDKYSLIGHTHDDRYYTESEMNSLLSQKLNTAGGEIGSASTAGYLQFNYPPNGTATIKINDTAAIYDAITFDSHNDNYGQGITIGAGGRTIIGGGEAAKAVRNNSGITCSSEYMIIANDGDVTVYTNLQNAYTDKKTFTFKADGSLEAPAFKQPDTSKNWVDLITGTGINFGIRGGNGSVYDLSTLGGSSKTTKTFYGTSVSSVYSYAFPIGSQVIIKGVRNAYTSGGYLTVPATYLTVQGTLYQAKTANSYNFYVSGILQWSSATSYINPGAVQTKATCTLNTYALNSCTVEVIYEE